MRNRRKTPVGYFNGQCTLLRIDPTTRIAVDAAPSTTAKAQAVLDALANPVTIKVLNGSGTVMGSGTMATPWATRTDNVLRFTDVSSFTVTQTGTPDATWSIRFESGTRYIEASFGLQGSGAEFLWSLGTWETGQTGKFGTASASTWKGAADRQVSDTFNVAAPTVSLEWNSLTPKNIGTFTQGTGGTYDLKQDATIPVGTVPNFVITSPAILGITVDPLTGILTVAPTTAVSSNYSVQVDLSPAVSLSEQDWLLRTGRDPANPQPGVVWYHDFRNPAELTNFLRNQDSPTVGKLASTPFGESKSYVSRCYGAIVTGNILANQTTVVVNDATPFPNPTQGTYSLIIGPNNKNSGLEWVTVTNINYSTNTLTVTRSTPSNTYAGGSTVIGGQDPGQWKRPFSRLPGSQNGRGVDDPGANGTVPMRSWAGYGPTTNLWTYSEGYYGHALHHTAAFDGNEFYLQFRAKIHRNRFASGRDSKFWYLQKVAGTVSHQFYGNIRTASSYDTSRWLAPSGWPYDWDSVDGGTHIRVSQDQSGMILIDPVYQVGGEYGATCVGSGGVCMMYAPDEWCTWLIHVKPGRNGIAESVFELFVAYPNEGYRTVMSIPNWTINYDNTRFDQLFGYNSWYPQNYSNADYILNSGAQSPPPAPTDVEYTQIIFSKAFIPAPGAGA